MTRPSTTATATALALALTATGLLAGCGDDDPDPTTATETSMTTTIPTTTTTRPERRTVEAGGTTLATTVRGDGPPVLLVHGAGEDAAMLGPLADQIAAQGHQVVTYDRRGTGGSGREDWPGAGAGQHADDAAAHLRALDVGPARVVGLSSGGVVALDLAVRHPDVVRDTVVWEAPAVGVIPGGADATAGLMAPVEAHLAAHPGDFVGAQAILLSVILDTPVAVDDPAFAATRANAESMVRDDPSITLRAFTAAELRGLDVTLAVGTAPNELVAAAGGLLAGMVGADPLVVPTPDHDVHLTEPATLAAAIAEPRRTTGADHG